MKIRNGFVSNSSSSSYLISYSSNIDLHSLFNFKDAEYSDDSSIDSDTYLDTIALFKEWYVENDWVEDQNTARFIKFAGIMKKEFSAGKEVAHITISYGDEESYSVLQNCSEIKILEDFG